MKKIGLALAGGGARGAYQIGAWKALRERGYGHVFDMISGASVGSLNAMIFAMDDYDIGYKVWMSLDKKSLFNVEKKILKRIFKEKLNFLNRGVYDTAKMEKLMDSVIDIEKLKGKDVFIATTHIGGKESNFFSLLKTNYHHYFKSEDQVEYLHIKDLDKEHIKKALLASCAIPIAFRPIVIKDETYYDGGILNNTPYQPLIEHGCTEILVIDLFKYAFRRKKEIDGAKMYYIYPTHSLRGILDFNHNHILRRFEQGYQDTIEFLNKNPEFGKEK